MPPTADDPPTDRVSADPPAATPPAAPTADATPGMVGDAVDPAQTPSQRQPTPGGQPPRRRRRRRRLPRTFSADSDSATAGAAGEMAASGDMSAGDTGPSESGVSTNPAAGGTWPAGERPRRRRRRPPPNLAPAPGALGSALPRIEPVATPSGGGDTAASEGSFEAGSGADAAGESSARPTLRLRRRVRGRRQLPRPPGLQRGTAETATAPDTGAAPEGEAVAAAAAAGASRAEREFPRRRQRRRPPPSTGDVRPAADGPSAAATSRDANPPTRGRGRYRRSGEDRSREAPPQHERAGERRPHGADRPRSDREVSSPGHRARDDRRPRDRAGGAGGARDGQRRGREAGLRRVEQKLYALESMVDRGFEDVPDEAEEDSTRRVQWAIVKRTVADQNSGKAMSTSYVLQREGGETEFANLGAARAAANKTIVHPEKLTMSKAEHAAAKASERDRR
jgi:hypothetical protein